MEVHFTPETEKKLDGLELARTREMLDARYDDLESGRVKSVPGDEVFARLRAKSAARRSGH